MVMYPRSADDPKSRESVAAVVYATHCVKLFSPRAPYNAEPTVNTTTTHNK
jgi:hypothetical protein